MRKPLVAVALVVASLLAAAPAQAALPTTRPTLTEAQLVQIHDCHPMYTTPTKPVMGWLRDNLATPQRDLVYVRSHGMALFGRYQTVRYCYR